jgi:choline dehydrogenase-like flavoprotein
MRDYVHWAVLGSLCDFLPLADNRVTLAEEKDAHGLPVARLDYTQCDNDRALMSAAKKTLVDILEAAGATQTLAIERYAHLVGGARMAATAAEGVIDKDGRTFAIPNLWVAGGSGLPTQGSANPALTIMAMAARIADRMLERQKPWTGP